MMKKLMKVGVVFMMQALIAFGSTAQAQDYDQEKVKAMIIESSQVWANVGVKGDPTPLETLFADDFIGTDSQGKTYTKRGFIDFIKSSGKAFVSNTVNEANVRFFGTVAIAQGNEDFQLIDGPAGRFYWTDIYALRDGKWQIIAAQDMMAPKQEKAAEGDDKGLFNTDSLSE